MILILSAVGIALSFYALYLEKKISQDADYKASCDISDTLSCSKPILSEYGKTFGVSNGLLGLLYYSILIVLVMFNYMQLVFYATIAGCIASAYFAYILFFKIRVACLVCIATYIINLILFLLMYYRVMY